MRIVIKWQPRTGDPQTVYAEDASAGTVADVERAFELRESNPQAILRLTNVGLAEGDPQRSEFSFEAGRLLEFEVQQ